MTPTNGELLALDLSGAKAMAQSLPFEASDGSTALLAQDSSAAAGEPGAVAGETPQSFTTTNFPVNQAAPANVFGAFGETTTTAPLGWLLVIAKRAWASF